MNRPGLILAAFLAIGGCASSPSGEQVLQDNHGEQAGHMLDRVTMLSAGPAGGLPQDWKPMVIFKHKNTLTTVWSKNRTGPCCMPFPQVLRRA